jgi:hypothetical protein
MHHDWLLKHLIDCDDGVLQAIGARGLALVFVSIDRFVSAALKWRFIIY